MTDKQIKDTAAEYDHCIGKKDTESKSSLADFLGIDDIPQTEEAAWKELWQDMPEYECDDKTPIKCIVSFETEEDREAFFNLLGASFTKKTKSLWFPLKEKNTPSLFRWITE